LELKKLSVVSLGGIVGSLARWSLSLIIVDHGFPWATLIVNYLGAIFLTAIVLYGTHHPNPKWWWRPLLGTGFCGGFTTYSAFAVKIDLYLRQNDLHALFAYALASIIGTFVLVFATHEYLDSRWAKR